MKIEAEPGEIGERLEEKEGGVSTGDADLADLQLATGQPPQLKKFDGILTSPASSESFGTSPFSGLAILPYEAVPKTLITLISFLLYFYGRARHRSHRKQIPSTRPHPSLQLDSNPGIHSEQIKHQASP